MDEVRAHYDLLIDEGNDPVLDDEPLQAYMDGWDGPVFMGALQLDGTQDVLEIGVGTGRLALRVAPHCRTLTGIDISEKSIRRAQAHLAGFPHVQLLAADFFAWEENGRFDRVYSSLTFLHFQDKRRVARRVAVLLRPGGRAVISLDKNRNVVLDYGTRQLAVYPDDPAELAAHLRAAGLTVLPALETERAVILTAVKGERDAWD